MEPSQAARVLEEHGRAVLHLAYSYLRSREEAEDVLQDTLAQYIRKAPSFDSQAHERAWLLRVAANFCKNRLKAPFRMGQGQQNTSGDYTAYPSQVELTRDGQTGMLSGQGELVSLAVWYDGENSFSLSFAPAVLQQEVLEWMGWTE